MRRTLAALALLLAGCADVPDDGVTSAEQAQVRHCEATWTDGNPDHTQAELDTACPPGPTP